MKHSKQIILPGQSAVMSRRRFVTGAAAGGALLGLGLSTQSSSAAASTRQPLPSLRGSNFDIDIGYKTVNYTGRERPATTFNGSVPGPILRWREGDTVTLRVTNHLAHDSSIHWHGIILPAHMDGVPGISFDGIKPDGWAALRPADCRGHAVRGAGQVVFGPGGHTARGSRRTFRAACPVPS